MRIAIIPARGGSKRVPMKNVKLFKGIPILQRTINVLKSSQLFDQVIVSTDSVEIQKLAISLGALSENLRPDELSTDTTPTIEVISHEIEVNALQGDNQICCVYAANPFLREDALSLGLLQLNNEPIPKYVTTVTTFPFPIQRALSLNDDSLMSMVHKEFILRHSQSLEERFHECAQFWWAQASTWTKKLPMQEGVRGIYVPRWMTQDIDTPEDWVQAEIRWEILQNLDDYKNFRISEDSVIN